MTIEFRRSPSSGLIAKVSSASWSLDQAYGEFPRIEDEFSAALDHSLNPRGPDVLFDLVAELDVPADAAALDVGCGAFVHSLALARRFGFAVTGIDPVARHIAAARAGVCAERAAFVRGTAEQIPARDAASTWSGAAMSSSTSQICGTRTRSSAAS